MFTAQRIDSDLDQESPTLIARLTSKRRHWRRLVRRSTRGPVFLTTGSGATLVLLSAEAYKRLIQDDGTRLSEAATAVAREPCDQPTPGFNVLCRFDAYADYIANVEADSAEEAAELASERHEKYSWESIGTAEFEAHIYITLDEAGSQIEATEIRNC